MLPNFLVIGAQKAGTTALHNYLSAHPQTFMSRPKELKFFIVEGNWDQGVDWYAAHFEQAPERALAVGEASPDYARVPRFGGVPERIQAVLPEARLIYVVRRPLDRIRSAYQHALAHGVERRPIDEAVRADPSYLDDSRYAMQIDAYLAVFAPERLLVLSNDALRNQRHETLAGVAEFLGIEPTAFPRDRVERDVYTSDDRRVPNRMAVSLRTSRWGQWLASVVPDRARERVRPHVERDVRPNELELSTDTVRWINHELAADRELLLARLPELVTWP